MKIVRILAIFFILLILFPSFQARSTKILINLNEDYARVNIISRLNQNLTDFPELNERVAGLKLIEAKESIQNAIDELGSKALVENISIIIFSSKKNLNINITFDLKDIITKHGNVLEINMEWKSFKIKDDLEFKGIHYNLIGENHLKPLLESWKNDTRVGFYLNKTGPLNASFVLEKVDKLSLLDFSILNTPLSFWNFTYDIKTHRTFWTFNSKPLIDLMVYKSDLNLTKSYYVLMNISSVISCFGFGKAMNDTVKINLGKGNYEIIMIFLIILLASINILIHGYIKRSLKPKKSKA